MKGSHHRSPAVVQPFQLLRHSIRGLDNRMKQTAENIDDTGRQNYLLASLYLYTDVTDLEQTNI